VTSPPSRLGERLWFAAALIFAAPIIVVRLQQGALPHGWWGAPVLAAYCLFKGALARQRRRRLERHLQADARSGA
jgi:hypothetical protein